MEKTQLHGEAAEDYAGEKDEELEMAEPAGSPEKYAGRECGSGDIFVLACRVLVN